MRGWGRSILLLEALTTISCFSSRASDVPLPPSCSVPSHPHPVPLGYSTSPRHSTFSQRALRHSGRTAGPSPPARKSPIRLPLANRRSAPTALPRPPPMPGTGTTWSRPGWKPAARIQRGQKLLDLAEMVRSAALQLTQSRSFKLPAELMSSGSYNCARLPCGMYWRFSYILPPSELLHYYVPPSPSTLLYLSAPFP